MISSSRRVVSGLLIAIAIFFLNFSYPESARATIQQQPEAPGQILYSSRHKLQDNQGNTWQVILFKRVENNQTQDIDLRLVAFPGQFEFIHPGNLTIVVNDRESFSASDRFVEQSPSPNVGEFEVQEIISNLPWNRSVNLVLPLTAEKPVEILLPAQVILEWQEI
ncbi:conserved hypothetical protein [Hyella patelloides LEGE 07179]|uniref:DUF3122 domain-containing protein n=1 Tax=Hyella patelloides LEGE 07179 TaxID=945734 RepID=A0A563VNP4_9CYAN|nr:DUF3122 domain-containing protein [Hyella patelloides]VEP13064.1 conserved hypothetical protein [Hyella patelloides LEGE 07179]